MQSVQTENMWIFIFYKVICEELAKPNDVLKKEKKRVVLRKNLWCFKASNQLHLKSSIKK